MGVRAELAVLVFLAGRYGRIENLTLNGCSRHLGPFPQVEIRKGQTRRRMRLSSAAGARAPSTRSVHWTLLLQGRGWKGDPRWEEMQCVEGSRVARSVSISLIPRRS